MRRRRIYIYKRHSTLPGQKRPSGITTPHLPRHPAAARRKGSGVKARPARPTYPSTGWFGWALATGITVPFGLGTSGRGARRQPLPVEGGT